MKSWYIPLVILAMAAVAGVLSADDADAAAAGELNKDGQVETEDFIFDILTIEVGEVYDRYLGVAEFKYTTEDPVIPDTVTFTEDNNEITLDVTEICYSAFFPESKESAAINTLTIGSNIDTIRDSAFYSSQIKQFIVDSTNSNFTESNGVLYTHSFSELVAYPLAADSVDSVDVPSDTLYIRKNAFYGATNISTVSVSDSLLFIGNNAFQNSSLTHITSRAEGSVVYQDQLPESLISIGNYAFNYCSNLTSLKFNSELSSIGDAAFSHSGLTAVDIPSGIIGIGDAAFSYCTNLTAFTSDSTTFVAPNGVLMHSYENNLTLVCYPAGAGAESYIMPSEVKNIESWAFSGTVNLKNVTLSSSLVTIGGYSFSNCTSLESVTIPDTLRIIDYGAFSGTTNLKSITLPSKLTDISYGAFSESGLESVTIPASVSLVAASAFIDCTSLKKAVFEADSYTAVGPMVFSGCYSLEKVEILSSGVTLDNDSLSVITDPEKLETYTYTVLVPSGYSIPDSATNEHTIINVEVIGERPYPYENLIGVVFCLFIVFGILYS